MRCSGWRTACSCRRSTGHRRTPWPCSALLGTRAGRGLSRSLLGLRVTGVHSGRTFELPVQYAVQQGADEDALIVVPLHQEQKTWWRNLRVAAPLEVLYDGRWRPAYGRVVGPDDPEHAPARTAYGVGGRG